MGKRDSRKIVKQGGWDGPLPAWFLWACLCAMLLGYAVGQIAMYIYDADVFFLAATGREMVEAGTFLRENPWSLDSGLAIVVQQWLYCLLVYFAEQGGYVGLILFVLLENLVAAALAYKLFRLDGLPFGHFVIGLFVAVVLCTRYQFSDRPECVTVVLLLVECYGLEKAGRTGRTEWLWLLPASTFLEINLHGSMWFVHYAVLLAYIVPDFLLKRTDGSVGKGLREHWDMLLAQTILSLLVLFVNPYGWKGITYVFDAFRAGTFGALAISEQAPMLFVSFTFLSIAVLAVGCCICILAWKEDCVLRTQTLYLSLGFALMAAYAVKNAMFLVVALLMLFRDLARGIERRPDLREAVTQRFTRRMVPVLLLCVGLFVLFPISRIEARFVFPSPLSNQAELEQVSAYIEGHGGKDSRVFTGFNVGCYFEYWGYHNIYMDARPELYTEYFNGKRDILFEYVEYCMDGYVGGEEDIASRAERIDSWFDGYDFDYVVVHAGSERLLAGYMLNKDGYRMVDDFRLSSVVLYEKAGAEG